MFHLRFDRAEPLYVRPLFPWCFCRPLLEGTPHMLVRPEHLGVRSVASPAHSVAGNF